MIAEQHGYAAHGDQCYSLALACCPIPYSAFLGQTVTQPQNESWVYASGQSLIRECERKQFRVAAWAGGGG